MASVPSTSARAAVARCPRRVLQAKGAIEKRPGRYDTPPTALLGHPRWTVGEGTGASLTQMGTPGLWGKAQQMFAAVLRGGGGFCSRTLAPCGALQLGKTCFAFRWSMQRRGVHLPQHRHSFVPAPGMLRDARRTASLHVVLRLVAPALWEWPLLWKEGRSTAVILFQFTACVRKRDPEEHVAASSSEDSSLVEEHEEGSHLNKRLLAELDRTQQGSPASTLLWKVLLTGQDCTSQETPSSTYLMTTILKENSKGEPSVTSKQAAIILQKALLVWREDARLQPATTTKRTATILAEAVQAWLEDTSHDPPTPTELAATILKEALLTGQKAILQHNALEIQKLLQQQCIPGCWWDR